MMEAPTIVGAIDAVKVWGRAAEIHIWSGDGLVLLDIVVLTGGELPIYFFALGTLRIAYRTVWYYPSTVRYR